VTGWVTLSDGTLWPSYGATLEGIMDWKFEVGQRVRKKGGYPFPGIVEARFLLTQITGERVERYVVNQTVVMHRGIGPSGLGHIFSPDQLEAVDGEELIGIAPMDADQEGEVRKLRRALDELLSGWSEAVAETTVREWLLLNPGAREAWLAGDLMEETP
jgi:hypothetical protein